MVIRPRAESIPLLSAAPGAPASRGRAAAAPRGPEPTPRRPAPRVPGPLAPGPRGPRDRREADSGSMRRPPEQQLEAPAPRSRPPRAGRRQVSPLQVVPAWAPRGRRTGLPAAESAPDGPRRTVGACPGTAGRATRMPRSRTRRSSVGVPARSSGAAAPALGGRGGASRDDSAGSSTGESGGAGAPREGRAHVGLACRNLGSLGSCPCPRAVRGLPGIIPRPVEGQPRTTSSSRGASFRTSGPDSSQTTMSSIRTPKRPAR